MTLKLLRLILFASVYVSITMNRLLLYLVILSFLIGVNSCNKDKSLLTDKQLIEVTIKSNEDYFYDLGGYGDKEQASITRQATHYQMSSIIRASNSVNITYKYKPAQDYVGTDEVELKSEKNSDGASPNDIIIITTIKFTITN